MKEKLISICIPSYNRPEEIGQLLNSIDSDKHLEDLEIVICEDKAPKRQEVRAVVQNFKANSKYQVNYIENVQNCGYDKNLRNLINNAQGEYVLFMGDDDMFIPGRLDGFIDYVSEHRDCGYILRSYQNVYSDGSVAEFKYFDGNREFSPAPDTYISMFDKSVFISGFTIKREYAKVEESDKFDGSLLYQMYLLTEVCRKYPSGYYNTPITQAIEGGTPFFGNSESEKDLYDPGEISVRNSVNFMKWYCKVVDYSAEKYQDDTNRRIKHNMSKYSYNFMCVQRNRGVKTFNDYVKDLKQMGFGTSVYFYLYYIGLLVFGEKKCTKTIQFIKKKMGRRPHL